MNYFEAINFIHSRPRLKKKPTLDRMRELLSNLENPQNNLPTVHIAGTNGKGSTLAYLRNLLQISGKTVGSFTSPFMISFNERISVNGIPITNDELLKVFKIVYPVVLKMDENQNGPTEFEMITAMMLVYFKNHPVDIVLVEVGIGGKYDSTNVINPLLSIITTIDFDHMAILGDTLEKIAFQKAGIIKENVPIVVGNVAKDPLKVISQQATLLNSPIYYLNQDFKVNYHNMNNWKIKFDFKNSNLTIKDLESTLIGKYQAENAGVAIEAYLILMEQFKQKVNTSDILKGIEHTTWMGRFELLSKNPNVFIDGAHNEPAIKEISEFITNNSDFRTGKLYIIVAILADKEAETMLSTLSNINDAQIILTRFKQPTNREIFDVGLIKHHKNFINLKVIDNWKVAINQIFGIMDKEDSLIITGSLYFISDVRNYIKEKFNYR